MAAYLYYERSSPVISDSAFDDLCKFVACEWEWLEPIRQFQLGSPEDLLATGMHIKITRMGEDAALHRYRSKMKSEPHGKPIHHSRWVVIQPYGCGFATLIG